MVAEDSTGRVVGRVVGVNACGCVVRGDYARVVLLVHFHVNLR